MASSSAKRSRKQSSEESKYIPFEVLSYIFTFLSIREAVRAGAVATDFRDSWQKCRDMDFGKDFAKGKTQEEYVAIVKKVLAKHTGSEIQTFHLNLIPTGFEPVVVKWIQWASEKGVKEIELNFLSERACYRLISESFNIPTLRVMRLAYCGIEITPLNQLGQLETIVFRKVKLVPDAMDAIFEICTRLHSLDMSDCNGVIEMVISTVNQSRFEILKIGDCRDMWRINIDSPTLTTFYYRGRFASIELDYVPKLINTLVNLSNPRGGSRYHKIGTLADYLSYVNILTVSSAFVEELSWVKIIYSYSFCFRGLCELQLILEDARYCSIFDVACILNHCPSLEKLFIDLDGYLFEGKNWTEHAKNLVSSNFKNKWTYLRDIKITGFRFCEHEVDLVHHLMDRATLLENLVIITPKNRNAVVSLPNAFTSYGYFEMWKPPLCKILVREPANDSSGLDPTHSKVWYSNYNLFKEPYF